MVEGKGRRGFEKFELGGVEGFFETGEGGCDGKGEGARVASVSLSEYRVDLVGKKDEPFISGECQLSSNS